MTLRFVAGLVLTGAALWWWQRRRAADLGTLEWSLARRQRAEEATARYLLGACGPVVQVGDRVVEERDRRVRQQRTGDTHDQQHTDDVRAWREGHQRAAHRALRRLETIRRV